MRTEKPQDVVPDPNELLFTVAIRENQRRLTEEGLMWSSWDLDRENNIFRVKLQPSNSKDLRAEEIIYRVGSGKDFSEAIRNAIENKG